MTHRGAVAADGKSGDGCGLLLRKPVSFLRNKAAECGFAVGRNFAVGMVFLNQDTAKADIARQTLNREVTTRKLTVNGWRVVPTNPDACGLEAKKTLPQIEQIFVTAPDYMDAAEFNRNLFVARRKTELSLRCLLYTSPSPRDRTRSRMPSSA